jgi:hypothetical protein
MVSACTFSKVAQITSDPSGARVRVAGKDQGTTPAAVKMGCKGLQADGQEIELSLENYRTLKATAQFKTATTNVIVELLFFVPGLFFWAKCPEDVYSFRLDKAVADMGESSTLVVSEIESSYDMFVEDQQVVPGKRMVFQPGWHQITAMVDGRLVPAAEILLEPATDHVVGFGAALQSP